MYARSSESMRELDDASVTLTITSPPYFNAIDYDRYAEGKNGDPTEYRTREYARGFTPGDYESYLALMQRVFREVYRVTKPGGWCVVVVSEVRHQGRCYAIPFDLTTRMQDLGWTLSGSGQTGKVALALGRRFVGYEIEPEFAVLSRTRLREPLGLRRVQVVRRVEHLEDDPFLRAGLKDETERDAA